MTIQFSANADLIHRLITNQFPQWSELPIVPVDSGGTDNDLFRLGGEMVIRLPRLERVVSQIEKEQQWLPRLVPYLPLAIPEPLVKGEPDENFPWPWSIYRWIDGDNAINAAVTDWHQAAVALAHFVKALWSIDTTGGPPAGAHNFYRGIPLHKLDAPIRHAIASLDAEGLIDTPTVTTLWNEAIQTPGWQQAPVWVHGDIHAGNLLVNNGALSAVIDFGGLGVGDPACDLIVAWNFLDAESRHVFRNIVNVDNDTWARGRGWALYTGLISWPYYLKTNPVIVRYSERVVNAVLTDTN